MLLKDFFHHWQETTDRGGGQPCAPLSTAQCSVPLLTSPPAEGIKVGEEARPYVESQSVAGWSQCSLDTQVLALIIPLPPPGFGGWLWQCLVSLSPLSNQSTSPCVYTGFSFSSILQVGRTLEMDYAGASPRYTPSPMLNPLRRGSGLYCSLLPSLHLRPGELRKVPASLLAWMSEGGWYCLPGMTASMFSRSDTV